MKPSVLGVIPARFASTRFPGKPLAKIQNREMILWVIEGAKKSQSLADLVVATDDLRIAEVVERAGCKAVMTDAELPTGTDRIFSALQKMGRSFDTVVNIQGDEPLVSGELIDKLVAPMIQDPTLEMATLAQPLVAEDLETLNSVKVVVNRKSEALYFSRYSIPFSRVRPVHLERIQSSFKHVGMYAYKTSFLAEFCRTAPVELEVHESLEQLRALAMGGRIKVVVVDEKSWGVDTPEDLAKIEEILRTRR